MVRGSTGDCSRRLDDETKTTWVVRSTLETQAGIIEKLRKRLKPFSEQVQAAAAVALIMREDEGNLELLVVKRVENPKDPWSGQMALPGGRSEPGDRNLKETAIRETLEETNVNLLVEAQFLGVLEPLRSAVRHEMSILPFIFLLNHEPEIKLSGEELEKYIWVTPRQLLVNKGSTKFSFGTFPAYIIGDSTIWGLTYTILTKFLEVIE
jgi:8-oxo-dGTP pyrophosphatase MutT (NUDIX family)